MNLQTLAVPLILIGVVVYGLTKGLKRLLPGLSDSWLGVAVRAIPALSGMVFGVIPGVFPMDITFGLCMLLGGAAGVFCAWSYDLVTTALKKKAEALNGSK